MPMRTPVQTGKTGQDVSKTGLYVNDCCGEREDFDIEEVFRRCPNCKNLCTWEIADGS